MGRILTYKDLFGEKPTAASVEEKPSVSVEDGEPSENNVLSFADLYGEKSTAASVEEKPSVSVEDGETEFSGGTGFEDDNFDLRRETNDLTLLQQAGDLIGDIFSSENILSGNLNVSEMEKRGGEEAFKITANTAIETATSFVEIVDALGQVISPETTAAFKATKFGQFYSSKLDAITPEMDKDSKIASDVLSYLSLAGAGRKIFKEGMELLIEKFGKTKAKTIAIEMNKQLGGKKDDLFSTGQKVGINVAAATGLSAGAIQADVQVRPEDLQITSMLVNTYPETFKYISDNVPLGQTFIELSKQLEFAEDDTERTKLIKRYGDATLLELPLTAVVNSIIMLAKYGPKVLKSTAIKVADTETTKAVINSKAAKTVLSNPAVKSTVVNVGKFNTKLGRIFTSRAAMPEQLYNPSVTKQNALKGFEADINFSLTELKRKQKFHQVSDDSLESYFNTGRGDIHPAVKEIVDDLKITVNQNEKEINSLLGLTGGGKLGLRKEGQDFYVTKTYSAALSGKDNKKLSKAVSTVGTGKPIKDSEIAKRVAGAEELLRRNGMTDAEIRFTLQRMLDNIGTERGGLFKSLFEGTSEQARKIMEANSKVLTRRKDIPEGITAFLGEVKNPYRNFQETLMNQNKLLTQLRYFKDVERIASETAGTPLKMPGLFPFLPSRKEAFRLKKDQGDTFLSELVETAVGKFGGSPGKILNDPAVSAYFAQAIGRGLDVYDVNNKNGLMSLLGKVASFGQAKETILDAPAVVLNTAGMGQMLLANGYFFNPKNMVRAVEEINTLAQQIIKKDPQALEILTFLKGAGVIDQDVTGEMIAQNARIFGDKKGNVGSRAYAKTMEKFGRAYGQPDLYGKLVAFRAEQAAQRSIHPMSRFRGTDRANFRGTSKQYDDLIKKEYDTFINTNAAEIVKATMPTYGSAPAAFRQFARVPLIGNYTLFPVEITRTSKNIVKLGLKDLAQGSASGNAAQVATGLRRLGGISTVGVGVEQIAEELYDYFNITDDARKTMEVLKQPYAAGGINFFMEPLVVDETKGDDLTLEGVRKQFPKEGNRVILGEFLKDVAGDAFPRTVDDTRKLISAKPSWPELKEKLGFKGTYEQFIRKTLQDQKKNYKPYLRTRTLNSAAANTFDYISQIGRIAVGKAYGNKIMSEQEVDNNFESVAKQMVGQFVSPKFATQAFMNVITGVDQRTGKPLYDQAVGATAKDKFLSALDAIDDVYLSGGTRKIIADYISTVSAEELLGLGLAERKSGRPMNMDDLKFWLTTGARPQTRNLNMEIGWNLYTDMKAIAGTEKMLQNSIKKMEPQLLTPEKIQEFVKVYRESQERKREGMRNLSNKVKVLADTPYTRIYKGSGGKKQTEQKRLGFSGVLSSATDEFFYKANPALLLAAQGMLKSVGKPMSEKDKNNIKFVPDIVFDKAFIKTMQDSKFTQEQIIEVSQAVRRETLSQLNRPLFVDVPEQEEGAE